MAENLPAPVGLGARGRRYWRSATKNFDPTDSERELLAEACRVMDNLDNLAAAIVEMGPVVLGSQGQKVVNPCLTESRGQQVILYRLLAALDSEEEVKLPSVQKIRASKAASARWQGQRAQVARRVANGTD